MRARVSETVEEPSARAGARDPRQATVGLERVGKSYADRRSGRVRALEEITLELREGEVVAVVGPSGCGKSTLLELVCGLLEPDTGALRAAPAALMPQRDMLLPWLAAIDNAALALRIAGHDRAAARRRAQPLFAAFGLANFERARPAELSGGMRQRVAFLRTLLSGKPVLCLDEPFGALDALTRQEMQAWLSGALTQELEVPSPRPRSRTAAALVALRERALEALR